MKKGLVSVLVLGAISVMSARHAGADYCAPYVYIDCRANHHLYVRSRWVCDSETPSTKYGHAFDTEALKNNTQECQISKGVTAVVSLSSSGGGVTINNKIVAAYAFGDPNEGGSDLFLNNKASGISITAYDVKNGKRKKRKPVYLDN